MAVFAGFFVRYGLSVQALGYALLACLLCGLAVVDIKTFTIPNGFILAGIALWLISVWFISAPAQGIGVGSLFAAQYGQSFVSVMLDGLLGAFVVSAGMLLFSLLFDKVTGRASLGGGDVKLFFMVGLFLGLCGSLFNLMLSCFVGLGFSVLWARVRPLSHTKKQEARLTEKAFPFGPAIAVSTIITLLIGFDIMTWYEYLFM